MSNPGAFIPVGAPSAFTGRHVVPRHVAPPPVFAPIAVKMVAAKPAKTDPQPVKLSKVEGLKSASQQLRYPLKEELANDQIFITEKAVQIMKFHGSYQQDNRELRKPGQQKAFQFMLRLKMPAGEFPAEMYQLLDDISVKHGNNTLRATTRCAWQIHGILKGDLKTVFSAIMNTGGSCIGACGDLSRNVMTTPAPSTNKLYTNARFVSKMLAELFAPQTGAFSELWLDGEKAATMEYWKKDIDMDHLQKVMRHDNGNGIVYHDKEEPIYGETYLPRKFKIGVTVPGDNSIDIYTQDIGVVCVPDASGEVIGYNIIVGGGMGRAHRKDSTFPRLGDHLGFVTKDKLWEATKAIVATQRDHGNRSVRANARMKYLVDRLGIDSFRKLVEGYFGEQFEPYRDLPPWKYEDWLGWHEQGDGNLFLGLFVENGRIKDTPDMKLKTALRRIIDAYGYGMIVTPNQNIILKDITPQQKDGIEAILKEHRVKLVEEYVINKRISMACPAMPLCGLAVTEAERIMPDIVDRMDKLFLSHNITVPVTMRMTGCPNGCARPYMAEIGFVGSGPKTYQLWLGGNPAQTRLAWPIMQKVKEGDLEKTLAPWLVMYTQQATPAESFGDFCHRIGKDELLAFAEGYASKPSLVNGEASLAYEIATEARPTVRITVARGTPKVTVVGADGSGESVKMQIAPKVEPKVEPKDVKPVPMEIDTGRKATPLANTHLPKATASSVEQNIDVKEPKASDTQEPAAKKPRRKKPVKPRLTISDELMERLKNIAALRDLSASQVADEIIAAFLSGVDDEELAMEMDTE